MDTPKLNQGDQDNFSFDLKNAQSNATAYDLVKPYGPKFKKGDIVRLVTNTVPSLPFGSICKVICVAYSVDETVQADAVYLSHTGSLPNFWIDVDMVEPYTPYVSIDPDHVKTPPPTSEFIRLTWKGKPFYFRKDQIHSTYVKSSGETQIFVSSCLDECGFVVDQTPEEVIKLIES